MAFSGPFSGAMSRPLSRPFGAGDALLDEFSGAAAAYSLQNIRTKAGQQVVRARRSTDDTEQDFNGNGVKNGALRHFALNNDADLIRFADQANATDKRMYFDGSDDRVTLTTQIDLAGDFTLKWTAMQPVPAARYFVLSNTTASYVEMASSNTVNLKVSSGSSLALGSASPPRNANQVYNFEIRRSGSTVSYYLDGVFIESGTLSGTIQITDISINNASFCVDGLLYDVELHSDATGTSLLASYQGYGNTNGDWEDQVGSNDGTVNGSPALFSGQGFDAYVTTWYDQSGNGRNATQTTAASQPQIVDDGVVVTDANGRPEVLFDGTNDALNLGNMSGWGLTSGHIFQVLRADRTLNASQGYHSLGNPIIGDRYTFTDSKIYDGSFSTTRKSFTVSDGTVSSQHLNTSLSTSSEWTARLNGSQVYTTATNTPAFGTVARLCESQSAGLFFQGSLSEVIIYGADQSSNEAAIESQIAARYGITLP